MAQVTRFDACDDLHGKKSSQVIHMHPIFRVGGTRIISDIYTGVSVKSHAGRFFDCRGSAVGMVQSRSTPKKAEPERRS